MSDNRHNAANLAASIALNLLRALLYPLSVLFRLISLYALLLRTLIAVWIPVAIGLAISTAIGPLLCDMHQALKVALLATGVVSLLMMRVAKESLTSLQVIVTEIRTLNVLPLPSWKIKKGFKDTSNNFKEMPKVAKKCLKQSWVLGAMAFLVVTSIALGYPDREGCKATMEEMVETIESVGDNN